MANISNGRCFAQVSPPEPPIIQHGSLKLAAHDIGWILTGSFTIIAAIVSAWLINKHLQWYTNKLEQRYIIRILLMVPIYAVVTFTSYLFWNHSTALLLIRDCYEAIVLTAFFYLILAYLSPDPNEQKEVFRKAGLSRMNDRDALRRGNKPAHWMFPLQGVRWKPEDGLLFLQLMKWGVLQYCVIRPTTTLAAVILNYVGLYCDDSWSPGWGHLYITVIMSISVTIAMYCLLQLYMPISPNLAPQKPLLKLFAVKAVVFLTFWQETLISMLEDVGVIKDTQYMTADNIATGVSAILETFEMVLFAFLHIRAYTYKVYRTPSGRTNRWRALLHALNFKETLQEVWAGTVYMARRLRGRETDLAARREAVMEDVFGKSRYDIREQAKSGTDGSAPRGTSGTAEERGHAYMISEKGRYDYPIYQPLHMKEKSDGLEVQIERGLEQRGRKRPEAGRDPYAPAGYAPIDTADSSRQQPSHTRDRSWFRALYTHVSRSSTDDVADSRDFESPAITPGPRSKRRRRTQGEALLAHQYDFEDPPPPSMIRRYRDSQGRLTSIPEMAVHLPRTSELPASIAMQQSPVFDGLTNSRFNVDTHLPTQPEQSRDVNSVCSSPTSQESDRFLDRVFRNLPPSSSTEGGSTGPSSSQSHRTRVNLSPEPQIVIREMETMRTPTLERPHNAPGVPRRTVARVLSPQYAPPEPFFEPSPVKRQTETMPHPSSRGKPPFRPRFTPHKDQIVLPAPLAPALSSPRSVSHSPAAASTSPPPAFLPLMASSSPTGRQRVLGPPLHTLYPSRPLLPDHVDSRDSVTPSSNELYRTQ